MFNGGSPANEVTMKEPLKDFRGDRIEMSPSEVKLSFRAPNQNNFNVYKRKIAHRASPNEKKTRHAEKIQNKVVVMFELTTRVNFRKCSHSKLYAFN